MPMMISVVMPALWIAGILSLTNAGHCSCNQSTTDFQFSIRSHRNVTGQWVAKVELGSDSEGCKHDVAAWEIDVNQTTTKCKNAEVVQIVATITVPKDNEVAALGRPSPDYEYIPGFGYYKMHVTNKTWHEAYHFCALEGAHLLILNSEEEAQILKRLWVKHPGKPGGWNWAYVGFHCFYSEGNFVTLFNQPLEEVGYNKWYPGHPGASPSRFCGIVHDSMLLGDTICNDHLAFICEQEM